MASKVEKPKYSKTIEGYTVQWFFRRGYYDCTVINAAGAVAAELEYPKIGPHSTYVLDEFSGEAVMIAKRKEGAQ